MIKSIKQNLVILRNYLLYKKFDILSKVNQTKLAVNPNADFVVSIASYPKRSHLLPAVYEALNEQTKKPKKWILVLSEEEWPQFDLPTYLVKLVNRGLEIIWVKNNTYAVKKLVPVIEKYPNQGIVTLDDDIIYSKHLLAGLLEKKSKENTAIVGYVGKSLLKRNEELNMYFREKQPADINTPSSQVYLIGWGGIYYPPHSLHKKVLDLNSIQSIVPGRGSDIWFWAAAIAQGTTQICLGMPENYNLGIPIPQNLNTEPKDQPKLDVLFNRFQMAIDFFEIRDKLLTNLPNIE